MNYAIRLAYDGTRYTGWRFSQSWPADLWRFRAPDGRTGAFTRRVRRPISGFPQTGIPAR